MAERTPDDVLKALVQATDEAKATIRELHEARKALVEEHKREQRRITDLLVATVEREVAVLRDDVKLDMRTAISQVMDQMAADWRAKLGLEPKA